MENNTPITPITVSNYNEHWDKILQPDCEKNQQKKTDENKLLSVFPYLRMDVEQPLHSCNMASPVVY